MNLNIATGFKEEEINNYIKLNSEFSNKIKTLFGVPYDIGLDGGREFFAPTPKVTTLQAIAFIQKCNTADIGFNHVFNSTAAGENDLDTSLVRRLLDSTHNKLNGVICSTYITRDFIKSNYPRFQLTASRIFNMAEIDRLQQLFKDFDIVVLPEQLNNDLELIGRLPKKQAELIANSFCHHSCMKRDRHYNMISEYNLKFIKIRAEDEKKTLMMDMLGKFGPCVAPDMGDIDKVRIEPEDLWKYRKLGICRLKILDRLRIPQPWEVEEYLIGLQDKRENILNAVSN